MIRTLRRLRPVEWVMVILLLCGAFCATGEARAQTKMSGNEGAATGQQGQKRAASQAGKTERRDATPRVMLARPLAAGRARASPARLIVNHCARRSKGVASVARGGNKEPPMPPGPWARSCPGQCRLP